MTDHESNDLLLVFETEYKFKIMLQYELIYSMARNGWNGKLIATQYQFRQNLLFIIYTEEHNVFVGYTSDGFEAY